MGVDVPQVEQGYHGPVSLFPAVPLDPIFTCSHSLQRHYRKFPVRLRRLLSVQLSTPRELRSGRASGSASEKERAEEAALIWGEPSEHLVVACSDNLAPSRLVPDPMSKVARASNNGEPKKLVKELGPPLAEPPAEVAWLVFSDLQCSRLTLEKLKIR